MTLKENQLKNYKIDVHDLGITEYDSVWSKMKNYSRTRNTHSSDLIWFTEHHAIYTLGQNGKDVPKWGNITRESLIPNSPHS